MRYKEEKDGGGEETPLESLKKSWKGNDHLLGKIVQDNRKKSKRWVQLEAVRSLRMSLDFDAFASLSLLSFSNNEREDFFIVVMSICFAFLNSLTFLSASSSAIFLSEFFIFQQWGPYTITSTVVLVFIDTKIFCLADTSFSNTAVPHTVLLVSSSF